jgi:hypothetical protein
LAASEAPSPEAAAESPAESTQALILD